MKLLLWILTFCFYTTSALLSQSIKINEVVASNTESFIDEDGDYPDWIELFNAGNTTQNFTGFWLSDNRSNLQKWQFPDVNMAPGEFRIIYASDKNRRNTANYWETKITWGDFWRYQPGFSEPPTDWHTLAFNDSQWEWGPSGFGYGDDDDSTIVANGILSVYIRNTFNIADTSQLTHALLHIDYDDGFVAYLNGTEIARANMDGIHPAFNQPANEQHEALIINGKPPHRFSLDSLLTLFREGENVLAIQAHNISAGSSDLTMIPFLTLGFRNEFPGRRPVHPLIEPNLPRLHTNFKLSAESETVFLSGPTGMVIDSLAYVNLPSDISWGRMPDGSDTLYYFAPATPGFPNISNGYSGIASEPQFSISGGFFDMPQSIVLSGLNPGETIRYTTNGNAPTETATVYSNPIEINTTTVIRARTFAPGQLPSGQHTQTYFFGTNHDLPVISISTDIGHFFDQDSGIYVFGNDYEPVPPFFGANFWEDWERPVNIELFETDGSQVINQGAGVKIYGGFSRANPQKSLAVFARGKYGAGSFDYPIFADKNINKFQAFILRNSGNDWGRTMFRDGFIHDAIAPTGIERLAYRPAVLYLNGVYWGILNIREKINEHFIESNTHIPSDSIEILEGDAVSVYGATDHYKAMINFVESNDLSDPANYAYLKTKMDVENFLRYTVSEIFIDNRDWPGNNIKFWRPARQDGRWRWIIFDTDFGFNLLSSSNHSYNTLAMMLDPVGEDWPNPPWSTLLFRKLIQNPEFRQDFINRSADYMNSIFRPEILLSQIDAKAAAIASEIDTTLSRWDQNPADWEWNIEQMRSFSRKRQPYFRSHIMQELGVSDTLNIVLSSNLRDAGSVQVNAITVSKFPWLGQYFKDIPVELTAIARPGFRFTGWTGIEPADSAHVVVPMSQGVLAVANFEQDNSQFATVVINEVNYNSAAPFDSEDWVEFYNNSGEPVDMSGWYFRDEDDTHNFFFPDGFVLQPDSFAVICSDTVLFTSVYPSVTNYFGNTGFGLSGNGELLRLYNAANEIVDSLTYDDNAPWPTEPDGNGASLSLKNPNLDNTLPGSWTASLGNGTPGQINDIFVGIDETSHPAIPETFALYQNFPNPFNPQTTILFDLPESAKVKVQIFDLLGRRVATLANRQFIAGRYELQWQPEAQISSGVYFYRIDAGEKFVQTRRMIFIR